MLPRFHQSDIPSFLYSCFPVFHSPMQRSLVMTVIGQDRPGLVESVADLVASHGGNWLESRMSRLGGQFAGILRVEVQADKEQGLVSELKALSARGLSVVVHSDQRKAESPPG